MKRAMPNPEAALTDGDQSAYKCYVLGDGAVGKTSALLSYVQRRFPTAYVPTVLDNYSTDVLIDGDIQRFLICDTAGQDEYSAFRDCVLPAITPASRNTVCLIFFNVMYPTSFHNIQYKWVPYVREMLANGAFVIVGTQIDRRLSEEHLAKLRRETGEEPIYPEQGRALAKKVGALAYMECSALTRDGLKDVFDTAIATCIDLPKVKKKSVLQKRFA
eukprot:Clim_evm46s229 gene=Clim_evmTU46s229